MDWMIVASTGEERRITVGSIEERIFVVAYAARGVGCEVEKKDAAALGAP
jgi:uncharacterized DUF497 family protein